MSKYDAAIEDTSYCIMMYEIGIKHEENTDAWILYFKGLITQLIEMFL